MDDWKDALAALIGSAELPDGPADGPAAAEADSGTPAKLPRLSIFYEKKGRAGKPATIITGFDAMSDPDVADVARRLKQRLGCGGSSRGGEILLQGDRREQARELLRREGFKI